MTGAKTERCGRCEDKEAPLRRIKMESGENELLCKQCFRYALTSGEVDPTDPRVES